MFHAFGKSLYASACLLALCWVAPTLAALPEFSQVRADWRSSEAHLLDRNGALLQEIRIDPRIRRTAWTPLADISPALIAAVTHAEDRRFLEHAGVDWLAAGKAALTNTLAKATNEKLRGASTLSMQLAGLLDAEYRARAKRRDVGEKWRQMQAARTLESRWSKAEILEAYLNLVSFRGELVGIDAAARGLFDKRPAGLNTGEALILAALIRAPNAKPAEVARRVCALVPKQDCPRLKALTLNTLGGRYPIMPTANLAPHLAIRLSNRMDAMRSSPQAAQTSPTPNNAIRTTLDAPLQRHVHATLTRQLEYLAARNVRDAAALVVDNASGEVLAYVSVSSHDSTKTRDAAQNDGVQARRQAGSTLKPFLYGLAFEQRLLTAASPLQDEALSIATGSGQYSPQNYDQTFRGLVSARVALASSLNIPAVRTLKLAGLDPFAARLAEFGYAGLDEDADFYGYALALGSLDVSLEEQVNAYRSLANGGVYTPLLYTPLRYTSVPAPTAPPSRALSAEAAFLVADILSDRLARATTFGLENPLATRYWTAVKTGTSKDMRDNWCIGFSRRHSVGVWIGNFDGSPMHDVSGISGAAPAWAEIMNNLQAVGGELDRQAPPAPSGLRRKSIQPANEPPRREWFIRGTEPRTASWQAALSHPEIAYPGNGIIIALDPDIPADRQILHFHARNPPAGSRWQLDGDMLKTPDWLPTRGKYRLDLIDAGGLTLDRVEFEVR